MKKPARRRLAAFTFGASVLAGGAALGGFSAPAAAQDIFETPKYAAIVVDAKTGEVLYSHNADAPRLPASVTKVMTLYMTFEALASGKLSPTERITVSQHAANQAPSKLGLKPGETITVDDAIRAAAVKSANDMAVVLAERVGGDEPRFTQMMTARAHELGMSSTRFYNANGLPNPGANNITTARDLAILSRAVMRDYPQYYSYFSQREFAWRGHNTINHNRLMLKMPGVDGIKTGYTQAAGFNLAASAVRDGRRLITVVLGGPSTAARDNNVETLLTAGFDVLNRRSHGQTITLAQAIGAPDDGGATYARPSVEPGEPRPVMVAEAAPPRPAPAPAAQPAPAMALASMAPIPDPPSALPRPASSAAYMAIADTPKPRLIRASLAKAETEDDADEGCAPVRAKRHERRHHARGVAKGCTVQVARAAVSKAAGDCDALHGRKLKACEAKAAKAGKAVELAKADDACDKLHGRKLQACEAKATKSEKAVKLAKAEATDPCAKLRGRKLQACEAKATKSEKAVKLAKAEATDPCAKLRGRKLQACEAKAEVKIAKAEPKAVRGRTSNVDDGDYTIQVGSFDNRKVAQQHMEKVSEKFARLVASAAGQVSHAAGNYRVRFKGFTSETAAKSACHKLSAKGERCMVVAEG